MEMPLEAIGWYFGPLCAGVLANIHVWQDSGQLLLSCHMWRVCQNCCRFELRQDSTFGPSSPTFLTNSKTFDPTMALRNLTLFWESLPSGSAGWDGFLLLIDEVERFRETATKFSLALLDQTIPHFFGLAVS